MNEFNDESIDDIEDLGEQSTLNIDDPENAEQPKNRKTISNPTRSVDEFNDMVDSVYYEEQTHPTTGEKYTVPVYVIKPQPSPRDLNCNPINQQSS